MFKEKPFNVILFCTIVTISTAVLQYLNPDMSFFDGGLLAVVLLTIFLKDNFYTYLFSCISMLLVLLTAFYPHSFLSVKEILLQHLFSAVVIVMTSILVLYVKRLYRSIETEERQTDALFMYATEGIILTNKNGEILLVNPEAESLFGYKKEELLGKQVEMLIPMRFGQHHAQMRDGFRKHPSNRRMGQGRDLFAKRKDGSEFPVEVSLSFYTRNKEFYVIAFIIDITQRKKAEKELIQRKEQLESITADIRKLNTELENKVEERTMILREALEKLESSQEELSTALSKEKELNEIKSRFVSMASHEFRTPLSTVLSSASLLSKYTLTEDQEKREKHVRRIKDSVKHLNDLLEDFLSLGRLEEGKVLTETARFDVRSFLEEVVEEMKPSLKAGQEVHIDYSGIADFCTDKRLLKNILINLLGNAGKFSQEQSGIWLSAVNNKGELTIKVMDRGIGISEEDQQHMFTSFFRGRNATNIQGTGLGLHIVKRYVDLLHGRLSLDSRLGQGTTVGVVLPEFSES